MASNIELLDMLYYELNDNTIINCSCGKNTYDNDEDGIKSCKECGFISINNIEVSTEENEAYISNSSIHSNVENASLGTNICGSSYLSKINSWGIWMNNYKEKTFLDIIEVIKTHCANKIPKIIMDNAINNMKEINKAKHEHGDNKGAYIIIRGLNKKSLIAASIYYASKQTNHPLTTVEVAKLFGILPKDLTKGEKIFDKLSSKKKRKSNNISTKSEVLLFVERYSSMLKLEKTYKSKTLEIADNLTSIDQTLVKGLPPLLAIGCIFLCIDLYKLDISKKHIIDTVEIYSETILNKIFKSIIIYKNILCDNNNTKEWIETSNKIRQEYIDYLP